MREPSIKSPLLVIFITALITSCDHKRPLDNSDGHGWVIVRAAPNEGLCSVFFLDEHVGWVIGDSVEIRGPTEIVHHPLLLSTDDGGQNWSASILAGAYQKGLKDICFCDSHHGWIVGTSGLILRTTDGGNAWLRQHSYTLNDLEAGHFIDANRGWIVGKNGTLLSSADGGEKWARGSVPEAGDVRDVCFADSCHGWIVAQGGILRTEDGGSDWELQFRGDFLGVDFYDGYHGCAVGTHGLVATTEDGGKQWDAHTSSVTEGHLYAVDMTRADEGWVAGDGGIFLARNIGWKWSLSVRATLDNMRDVCFVSETEGWAVGGMGHIVRYEP